MNKRQVKYGYYVVVKANLEEITGVLPVKYKN